MSHAGDAHMHHPEEFDPTAKREFGQDGMIIFPGLRQDCELCNSRKAAAEAAKIAPKKAVKTEA